MHKQNAETTSSQAYDLLFKDFVVKFERLQQIGDNQFGK